MVKTPDATPGSEFAEPMRAAAEKSVEQARAAFENMMGVAQKAISGMETNASTFQSQWNDMGRDTLDFAGETVEATFALVEQIARAKTPQDVLALQQSFVQSQMERLGQQARQVSDTAVKTASDITKDLTKPFER